MGIYELISEDEKNAIRNYIESYASMSDNIVYLNNSLDNILKFWEEAKSEYLINLFGGKLILSKEIEIDKPDDELVEELCDLKRDSKFWHEYSLRLREIYGDEIYNYKSIPFKLHNLLNVEFLKSGRYTCDTFKFSLPMSEKIIKVETNSKIMKILSKISKELHIDSNLFEEFRISHSMILNHKKVKGELCLSIHPIDFMTMSDNNNRWSSCMSWINKGDYRQGTVEMMNSPFVVVGYIKSNKTILEIDNKVNWNSKKWRELFIVNGQTICEIKPYPYRNDELTLACLNWLKELANGKLSNYDDTLYDFSEGYVYLEDEGKTINFNLECGPYMYCDFGHSVTTYAYIREEESDIYVHYSGKCQCMLCGTWLDDYLEAYQLCCEDCDPSYSCSCCGNIITDRDPVLIDGEPYCEECLNECAATEAIYGEWYLYVDLVGINLYDENGLFWHERYFLRDDIVSNRVFRCGPHYFFKKIRYNPSTCELFVYPQDLTQAGFGVYNIFSFDNYEEIKPYNGIKEEYEREENIFRIVNDDYSYEESKKLRYYEYEKD